MNTPGETVHVLGFAGSLRPKSYNRAALRAAEECLPEGLTLEVFDIAGILLPVYSRTPWTGLFDPRAVPPLPAPAALMGASTGYFGTPCGTGRCGCGKAGYG